MLDKTEPATALELVWFKPPASEADKRPECRLADTVDSGWTTTAVMTDVDKNFAVVIRGFAVALAVRLLKRRSFKSDSRSCSPFRWRRRAFEVYKLVMKTKILYDSWRDAHCQSMAEQQHLQLAVTLKIGRPSCQAIEIVQDSNHTRAVRDSLWWVEWQGYSKEQEIKHNLSHDRADISDVDLN